jgi:hypothetical protein
MLNDMAGGVRRKGSGDHAVEEIFDRRSKSVKDWSDLVARRNNRKMLPKVRLQDFTDRGIIRLGLKSACPNCQGVNWSSLTSVDYSITCERCQKDYPFPQASLDKHNGNWSYRVVGPFAVPDFARGSYGALLALGVVQSLGFDRDRMTFATALSLKLGGQEAEADFVAWRAPERIGEHRRPELLVGEAKSFGKGDLLKRSDVAKLRLLASNLPEATIVVSVMRSSFTPNERALLVPFVNWCRRPNSKGLATNRVILLTATELFFDFSIKETWSRAGERYAEFADYDQTNTIQGLADATQSLYLDMPLYYDHIAAKRRKSLAQIVEKKSKRVQSS